MFVTILQSSHNFQEILRNINLEFEKNGSTVERSLKKSAIPGILLYPITSKSSAQYRLRFGHQTFLVGLVAAQKYSLQDALDILKREHLNLLIATGTTHKGNQSIYVFTAEGGIINFVGSMADVATDIVKFIYARSNVSWYASEQNLVDTKLRSDSFSKTLKLAQSMNLFFDTSGNITARDSGNLIAASPRQVDKSQLSPSDAILVAVEDENNRVLYNGSRKPSIDSGVNGLLYKKFPWLESTIHFHNGWGRMTATTKFPYPCGTKEEAREIIAVHQLSRSNDLAVELVHHGFILGLTSSDLLRLHKEWSLVLRRFGDHLSKINGQEFIKKTLLRPIFDGLKVVGVIFDEPQGAAIFLDPEFRGHGVGSKVVEQLIERNYKIVTIDDCKVRDYYKAKGFVERYNKVNNSYTLYWPHRQKSLTQSKISKS